MTQWTWQKSLGADGLIWMRRDGEKIQSPVVKFLSEQELAALGAACGGLQQGDVLFIMADDREKVNDLMGKFRLHLGAKFDLVRKGTFSFLWIVNFPLLEYSNEEKRYVARQFPLRQRGSQLLIFPVTTHRYARTLMTSCLMGLRLAGEHQEPPE